MSTNPSESGAACEAARDQFALMLYGELSFDEEERVEAHLDACEECRRALVRQRELHEAIDAVGVMPSPTLLSRSRRELAERLDNEQPKPWWREVTESLRIKWLHPVLQPVGALALLAMGFFGAKLTPNLGLFTPEGVADFSGAHVRQVAAEPDGSVRIIMDETRERTLSGRIDNQHIRALLMNAAKDAPDAGLRAQTVTILTGGADADDVRQALVFAVSNDRSDRVRVLAMQGLRPYTQDPTVQDALAQVVLQNGSNQVRTQAIDMLSSRQGRELNRSIVGAMQEMMDREDDAHVREQCRRMLEAIKASPEIY